MDPEARIEAGPAPAPALTAAVAAAQLRPLHPRDLASCLALDRLALGGLWSQAQWARELAEEARPGLGIWLEARLVAMACGWLVVDELHITMVVVDLRHRRCGLGRWLLTALLDRGRQAGARHATLEVAAPNSAARGLYRGAGFLEKGRRRAYYRNGDDALVEWLQLTP